MCPDWCDLIHYIVQKYRSFGKIFTDKLINRKISQSSIPGHLNKAGENEIDSQIGMHFAMHVHILGFQTLDVNETTF